MKKLIGLALCFTFYISFSQQANYDQLLSERNNLYNELQQISINDTITADSIITIAAQLLKADNVLLDEWIPLLHQQADSIKTEFLNSQTHFAVEKKELQKESEIFLYGGIGAAALAFVFLVLMFIFIFSKRKLKKKFKLQAAKSTECDNLLQLQDESAARIEELNKKLAESNAQLSEAENKIEHKNAQLTELSAIKSQLYTKDENMNAVRNELNNLKQESKAIRNSLESEIVDLKSQINELNQHELPQTECTEHTTRINELSSLLDREREGNINTLREKEELLEELRNEIHQLRSVKGDKSREELCVDQSNDLIAENNNLKRMNAEQLEVIEEYRQTLQKELENRKEFEEMIKKFF